MAVEFYCKISGAIIGPFSNNQLIAMAGNGKLTPEDFIRTSNSSTWIKANKISGLVFNNSKIDQAETEPSKKESSKFQATKNYSYSYSKSDYSSISILSAIYVVSGYVILILIPFLVFMVVMKNWGHIDQMEAFGILGFVICGAILAVSMLAFGQLLQLAINTADNIQLLTQSFVKNLKQPKDED
jgi:hypothetical protein